MDAQERELRQSLKNNFDHYSSRCLKIRPKKGEIIPFVLNAAQKYALAKINQQILDKGKVRAIILKGRQQGMSTLIEGWIYWQVSHRFGVRAFILTHEEEATNNLFDMVKRYHDNCPALVQPSTKASNAKELSFSVLDSAYKLGTAGNKSVGRSSTIQYLHASEAAFYKHASEHAKGIMQTVPNEPGTAIFIESTANGVGNWFHTQWQEACAGLSEYIPIFIPWYWQPEYQEDLPRDFVPTDDEKELKEIYHLTDRQLAWRRIKIREMSVNGIDGEKEFKQEYPNNEIEAFQLSGENSFIQPDLVQKARHAKGVEPYGPLLIGVDPARFGDDRTCFIRRRGRVAFKLESYKKKDTMEIVGLIVTMIKEENPDMVFIDGGGLGGGIVDRLKELGFKDIIKEVNSSSSPFDKKRYHNKRAEMWGLMKEWLGENASIPDDNALHSDLCGVKYKTNSNSALQMEAKSEMKARGMLSSDAADALGLTFAYPVDKKSVRNDEILKGQIEAITYRQNRLKQVGRRRV